MENHPLLLRPCVFVLRIVTHAHTVAALLLVCARFLHCKARSPSWALAPRGLCTPSGAVRCLRYLYFVLRSHVITYCIVRHRSYRTNKFINSDGLMVLREISSCYYG